MNTMRTYESMQALIQEMEGDATEIDRVLSRNRTAWERIEHGADDPVDWGALGFTIQTLYGVLESYFLRISKYFENNLPADRWHATLVERMCLEIPGVRPAFLRTREHRIHVMEIMRFRRRLRSDLHASFVAKLRSIADAL